MFKLKKGYISICGKFPGDTCAQPAKLIIFMKPNMSLYIVQNKHV